MNVNIKTSFYLKFSAALVVAFGLFAGAAQDAATPFAQFGFEEGCGAYAEDSISGLCAELTPSAKWAFGTFGTALAVGERGASATVAGLEAFDGADNVTLFVRFRQNDAGTGKYPNLLTSTGWGRNHPRGAERIAE